MQPKTVSVPEFSAFALALLLVSCGSPEPDEVNLDWSGTIDTLVTGGVVIQNSDDPFWPAPWEVEEQWRVGSDATDPHEVFGSIVDLAIDAQGRVYVLDEQTQDVRVFDAGGAYVRTVGGLGEGPGEFTLVSAVDISPSGEIWVMEMQPGQLSIFDSTGSFVRVVRSNNAGSMRVPYPGGFDRMGRYNVVFRARYQGEYTDAMARFDQSFAPLDTIAIPRSVVAKRWFSHETEDGSTYSTAVPFQGDFTWRFSPGGNIWTLLASRYELVQSTTSGERLRTVTKEFEPIRVTAAEKQGLEEQFDWFKSRGGKIDWSQIPDVKPAAGSFFCDDEGNLWVQKTARSEEDEGRLFDIFDAEGRFLGELRLPFELRLLPEPIVRNGMLYGEIADDSGAPVIVQARIVKPQEPLAQ